MSEAEKRRLFYWIGCALILPAAVLLLTVGCAKTGDATRESRGTAKACPYKADEDGNLIVDLGKCAWMEEDSAVGVLRRSSHLEYDIFLTHVTDQMYYALDSHCGHGGCMVLVRGKEFYCPCDSSRFSLIGAVLDSTATQPLRELPSLKNGDRIRITPK